MPLIFSIGFYVLMLLFIVAQDVTGTLVGFLFGSVFLLIHKRQENK